LYIYDGRGAVTKREAIAYIAGKHWFAFQEEDREPNRSQQFTTNEPRWHTLIAWARKDAVIADMVSYQARDAWGLTSQGRNVMDRWQQRFQKGQQSVCPCFLWSQEFKRFMRPEYAPGAEDKTRPARFYRDTFANCAVQLFC
jgi:hypothetical protein